MLTIAVKKSKSKVSGTRLNKIPLISTVGGVTPFESPLIQRKTNCACGGGCPRCQSSSIPQTKLKAGASNDKYEQEAERIAELVMRMPDPVIQRKPG